MRATNTRRSDRLAIALPIQVSGVEFTGQEFTEQTQTQVLSRHGAALVLSRKLAPQQEIMIHNSGTGREAAAQIIGQMGGQANAYIYGVAFLDPAVDLWDISFPPLPEAEKAVFRLLLQCNLCAEQERVYLDEFESEVIDTNRTLTRHCRRCGEATLWQIAPRVISVRRPRTGKIQQTLTAAPYGDHPESQNDRKNPRVDVNISACVRRPGFEEEEIVQVENASPGGLSFLSAHTYFAGSTLEVAVPYTREAENVFVRSRLISVQAVPGTKRKRYGVGYIEVS